MCGGARQRLVVEAARNAESSFPHRLCAEGRFDHNNSEVSRRSRCALSHRRDPPASLWPSGSLRCADCLPRRCTVLGNTWNVTSCNDDTDAGTLRNVIAAPTDNFRRHRRSERPGLQHDHARRRRHFDRGLAGQPADQNTRVDQITINGSALKRVTSCATTTWDPARGQNVLFRKVYWLHFAA